MYFLGLKPNLNADYQIRCMNATAKDIAPIRIFAVSMRYPLPFRFSERTSMRKKMGFSPERLNSRAKAHHQKHSRIRCMNATVKDIAPINVFAISIRYPLPFGFSQRTLMKISIVFYQLPFLSG